MKDIPRIKVEPTPSRLIGREHGMPRKRAVDWPMGVAAFAVLCGLLAVAAKLDEQGATPGARPAAEALQEQERQDWVQRVAEAYAQGQRDALECAAATRDHQPLDQACMAVALAQPR